MSVALQSQPEPEKVFLFDPEQVAKIKTIGFLREATEEEVRLIDSVIPAYSTTEIDLSKIKRGTYIEIITEDNVYIVQYLGEESFVGLHNLCLCDVCRVNNCLAGPAGYMGKFIERVSWTTSAPIIMRKISDSWEAHLERLCAVGFRVHEFKEEDTIES